MTDFSPTTPSNQHNALKLPLQLQTNYYDTMSYRQADRERQRYLTYEGNDPLPLFEKLFGAHGLARAGVQRHGLGVIRTTAQGVHQVRAAIALTPGCRSTRVTTSIRDSKSLAKMSEAHQ
jgi:hypothetical protein